jgi:hypothetical protein
LTRKCFPHLASQISVTNPPVFLVLLLSGQAHAAFSLAAQVSGSLGKEDKDYECKTSNWFSNKGW